MAEGSVASVALLLRVGIHPSSASGDDEDIGRRSGNRGDDGRRELGPASTRMGLAVADASDGQAGRGGEEDERRENEHADCWLSGVSLVRQW